MAKKIEVILELKDQGFKKGVNSADASVKRLGASSGNMQLGKSFSSAGPSILKFTSALGVALLAIAGVRKALDAIGSGIQAGATIENLAIQFETLTGSAKAGAEAFDTVTAAASKLPFTLEEIAKGSPALTLVADKVGGLDNAIQLAAGAAASFGIDFQTASSQLQRALTSGAASADTFRERGVNAFVGLTAGATYSAEETAAAFMDNFDKITAGVDKLADTFDGKMSMMGDAAFKVKAAFGETFNEALKGSFDFISKAFNENEEAVLSFAKAAATNLVDGLLVAGKSIAFLIDQVVEIANTVKQIFGPAFKAAGQILVFFADLGVKALGYLLTAVYSLGEAFTNFLSFIGVIDSDNAMAKFFKNGQVSAESLKAGMSGIPDFFDKIGESAGRVTTAQDAFAELEKSVRASQQAALDAADSVEDLAVSQDGTADSAKDLADAQKKAADAMKEAEKAAARLAKAQERSTKAAEKILSNTVGQIAAQKKQAQQQLELLNYFGQEKQVKIELNKIEEQRASAIAKINALENMSVKDKAARIAEINKLYDEQTAEIEKLTRALYENSRTFEQGFKEAFNTFKEDATNAATLASDLFTTAADDWRNAWVTAAETGKLSFGDLIDNMKKRLIMFLADAAFIKLTETLAAAFGINLGGSTAGGSGGGGGGGGKSIGDQLIDKGIDFVKGLFGFEEGGYVAGNRSIVVGEGGPEVFTPAGSGTITPNFASKGGGGTTSVTYNIQAIDSRSFVELLSSQPGVIHSLVEGQKTSSSRRF
mgnify:CR=1 FL=1